MIIKRTDLEIMIALDTAKKALNFWEEEVSANPFNRTAQDSLIRVKDKIEFINWLMQEQSP